jgi:hypothetical protein
VKLLPTPTEQDGRNVAGPSQEKRNTPPLNAMVRLLPTPTSSAAGMAGAGTTGGEILSDVALRSNGANTSQPSDDGSRSQGLRLNPSFVEWMIGAPQGWSDPDCPLSATEFSGSSASWLGAT